MPIYEYQCQKCEKIHEVTQKFSDAPLAQCPECGAEVKKLMSLSSFALKGSGWYTTDYKRSGSSSSSGKSE
jgi:putative FmdB family regulatory protein